MFRACTLYCVSFSFSHQSSSSSSSSKNQASTKWHRNVFIVAILNLTLKIVRAKTRKLQQDTRKAIAKTAYLEKFRKWPWWKNSRLSHENNEKAVLLAESAVAAVVRLVAVRYVGGVVVGGHRAACVDGRTCLQRRRRRHCSVHWRHQITAIGGTCQLSCVRRWRTTYQLQSTTRTCDTT